MTKIAIRNPFKAQLLSAKKPLLDTLTFRLFVNAVAPTDVTAPDAFVEAAWFGYRPVRPMPFGPALVREDGRAWIVSPSNKVSFRFPSVEATFFGWYATDDDGRWCLAARLPGAPIFLTNESPVFGYRIEFAEDSIP